MTICDLPPRAWPNRGTPPQGTVGLSHSYCDRDATDLTLSPQESQSVGAMQAMKFPPPPHMVPAMTRTRDQELAHGIPHRLATPLGAIALNFIVPLTDMLYYNYSQKIRLVPSTSPTFSQVPKSQLLLTTMKWISDF